MTWFAVAVGSALGGLARYALTWVLFAPTPGGFPWSTFSINAVGSLLIGIVAGLNAEGIRLSLSVNAQLFWMVGVFGGFTTFSAFSLQALQLLQQGSWLLGSVYIFATVAVCLIFVALGFRITAG